MLSKKKPNDSEYTTNYKNPSPFLQINENLQKHTLYQNLDSNSRASITKPETFGNRTGKSVFAETNRQVAKQSDFLTSYQSQFSQDQRASLAANKRSQSISNYGTGKIEGERRMTIDKSIGLKTTGKFELEKHDRNASHLYYLLETQNVNSKNVNENLNKLSLGNNEEHFKFGTYHWKRCDVTKTYHPGLAYR